MRPTTAIVRSLVLFRKPAGKMHAFEAPPCCKRCWFRQSRPRLARTLCQAQQSKPQNRPSTAAQQNPKEAQPVGRSRGGLPGSSSSQEASLTRPAGSDLPLEAVSERLVAYGDSHASAQADQLLAAVNDIRQTAQQGASSTAQGAIPQETAAVQPGAAANTVAQARTQHAKVSDQEPQTASSQANKSLSKAQMLAKLAQAKAYKQDKNKGSSVPAIQDSSSPPAEASSQARAPVQSKDSVSITQPRDSFSATQRSTENSEASSESPQDLAGVPEGTDSTGSAVQPARFLQQAMQQQSDASKTMSPEAYSLLREQQRRNQKVRPQPQAQPCRALHLPARENGLCTAGAAHCAMLMQRCTAYCILLLRLMKLNADTASAG